MTPHEILMYLSIATLVFGIGYILIRYRSRPTKEPNTFENHKCIGEDTWPNLISLLNHLGRGYNADIPDFYYWHAKNRLNASIETIKEYLRLLVRAGYVEIWYLGRYKVLHKIPTNLSLKQLREEVRNVEN